MLRMDGVLNSIPEWFAVRFLSCSAFATWNEVRFEREFKKQHGNRGHCVHHNKTSHNSDRSSQNSRHQPNLVCLRGILRTGSKTSTVLEPHDLVTVACGIKEATSTPLGPASTTQNQLYRFELTIPPSSIHENVQPRELGSFGVYENASLDVAFSNSESPPHSSSSDRSASTSVTIVTDPFGSNEEALTKNSKTPSSLEVSAGQNGYLKVGSLIDLDLIKLSARFEYQEDPKAFAKKYGNDKEALQALAFCLENQVTNLDIDEEIVDAETTSKVPDAEKTEAYERACSYLQQETRTSVIVKSDYSSKAATKHLFACSSLFDAHDYSIPRQPNDLHRLGNNFVGFDRYRMSAVLTREERLQKLVSACGETLEFSAQYFLEECPDLEATVPGHDDIQYGDLLEAKRQLLAKDQNQYATVEVDEQGCSIHRGFPIWNGVPNQTANFVNPKHTCVSTKQHAHHFGLGVFRVDPPNNTSSGSALSTAYLLSTIGNHFEESTSSAFSKDKSVSREMPGLIGDENNRFWPSQRAFPAIPPGHFLAPDRANAFRGLRLERDPKHPRWRRSSAPDPSTIYASGPPVAVRRHSEKSVPQLRVVSMYKRSYMQPGNKEKEKQEPQTLDGAMDHDEDEGVACGEPDPDIMFEFPKLDSLANEISAVNLKLEEQVVLKPEHKEKASATAPFDPLRQPREVRRVRFQL